jgi:N utilization substance protein A
MEVIVDDTQLSLAIGKKGQNVRLAAKLLGWKVDIKSEEEKRQEVESQMAALVVPGAPVSVLIDHGLTDEIAEKLIEASITTVEQLGSMTPEELEEIQGIGPDMVEKIQVAVNNYYGQFEENVPAAPEFEEVKAEGAPEALAAEPGPEVEAAAETEELPEAATEERKIEEPDTPAVAAHVEEIKPHE